MIWRQNMDVVSHALVGNVFKEMGRRPLSLKDKLLIVSFAFLADVPMMLTMYPLLGREHGRPFWFPYNTDWTGARGGDPVWSMSWEIPHSLLFWLLVIVPLVLWLRLPKLAIVSYLSHILLDLPTHTGEWGVKPFYPFDYMVNGVTDAWEWPLQWMVVSWAVLIAMGMGIRLARRRKCG